MLNLSDSLTAYCFDSAVVAFGNAIENALHETVNVGSDDKPQRRPKYTLAQLLTPGFVIEREEDAGFDPESLRGIDGMFYDEVD